MKRGLSPAFSRMTMLPSGPYLHKFNRRQRRQNELAMAPNKRIWLISFTDLMSLMTAFFVMMFAMSEMDKGKYQELRETFERYLGSVIEVTPKPYLGPPLKLGDVDNIPLPRVRYAQGLDPVYLNSVLSEKKMRAPVLQNMRMDATPEQVELSWPYEDLPALMSLSVAPELVDVLQTIPNDIHVRLDIRSNRPGDIQKGLRDAAALRATLYNAGYRVRLVTEMQLAPDMPSQRLRFVVNRSQEKTTP